MVTQPEGGIWLGDVMRALADLAPIDSSERQQVAALLGFVEPSGAPSKPLADSDRESESQPDPSEGSRRASPIVELLEPFGDTRPAPRPSPVGPSESAVPTLPLATIEPCDWYDPLLPHGPANILLRSILRTWCRSRRLERRSTVRHLALLRRVDRLPRKGRWSFRRGGQVLVDLDPVMAPFALDQADVARRASRLSRGRIEVIQISELPVGPTAVVGDAQGTWGPYHPPGRGAPALALSALGAVRSGSDPWASRPADWVAFAAKLERRGSPMGALVPFAPLRLPAALRRMTTVVYWDSTARRAWAAGPGRRPRQR